MAARNLIAGGKQVVLAPMNNDTSSANSHATTFALPIKRTELGERYTLRIDTIEQTSGDAVEAISVGLAARRGSGGVVWLNGGLWNMNVNDGVMTFTCSRAVPDDATSIEVFVYSGIYGATSYKGFTFYGVSLVKGERPLECWQPAPEEIALTT